MADNQPGPQVELSLRKSSSLYVVTPCESYTFRTTKSYVLLLIPWTVQLYTHSECEGVNYAFPICISLCM